jgi:probable F420-dependent oxidoreductase
MAAHLMRFGAVFPQNQIEPDGSAVRDFAQAIHGLGFDYLTTFDHILSEGNRGSIAGPGGSAAGKWAPYHEALVTMAHAGGAVPDLGLAISVLVLPLRQTALVARQTADLDRFTNGNFRLGVAVGHSRGEYEANGTPFKRIGDRLTEQVEVLRRFWSGEPVNFKGEFHDIRNVGIDPTPIRRNIPIYMGGDSEAALRRGAEIGDGICPRYAKVAPTWQGTIDQVREWREAAGKPWAGFGIETLIKVAQGTPDEWTREYREFEEIGSTEIALNTLQGGVYGVKAHLERLELAARALGIKARG